MEIQPARTSEPQLSPYWADLLASPVPQRLPDLLLAQELLGDLLDPERRDLLISRWLPWLCWSRAGVRSPPPLAGRLRITWLLWALLGLAGPTHRAPVQTLLAFDLWAGDQPVEARRLLSLALMEQPDYRLANLLAEVLAAQLRAPPAR